MISPELPNRKKNRLAGFDYSIAQAYFITICTENRRQLFWKDVGAVIDRPEQIPLSNLGIIVRQCIEAIPEHYPAITVENSVIMPDHVHLLLQINSDREGRSMTAPTISTVIRMMKCAVTKKAGFFVWQKGFYDHVVRGDKDYQEIWNYIEGNPGKG